MPPAAPLRVPVEIRPGMGPRCFRTACEVSEDGLALAVAVPDADGYDGAVELSFVLPDEQGARIACRGRMVEMVTSEERGAERRGVRFIALDEEQRALIARYVLDRLGLAT